MLEKFFFAEVEKQGIFALVKIKVLLAQQAFLSLNDIKNDANKQKLLGILSKK